MKTIFTDIPDEQEQVISWLEPLLISSDLRQLVSELVAVQPQSKKPLDSLDSIVGDRLPKILENGLEELPAGGVSQLVSNPSSLLELQEQILLDGGLHWRSLMDKKTDMKATINRTRSAIEKHITEQRVDQRANQVKESSQVVARDNEARKSINAQLEKSHSRRSWMAIAAGVLISCGLGYLIVSTQMGGDSKTVAWGWLSENSTPTDLNANEYLSKLGRGAEAWFNKRPNDTYSIRKRIVEFQSGCQKLIDAEHSNLDAEQQEWLRERLKKCLNDVSDQLVKLDESSNPIQVRSAVDQIIREVVLDLKAEAKNA